MENRLLGIGNAFPEYEKTAVVSLDKGKEFKTITHNDHKEKDQWMVMFWWPLDFTGVCHSEVAEFGRNYHEFANRNTVLIGASTDSEFSHLTWRQQDDNIRNLGFPMLADTSKSLAEALGILEADKKIAYRATFIVDPKGIIRGVSVYDIIMGRNVNEVLRTLDALQTGKFCPCNWEAGQETMG